MESSRPKPGRIEETPKGGRGPPWAVAPLERERERNDKSLRIVQWNANGLQSYEEETKLFLTQNFIDILLNSERHFTDKNYFSISRYKLFYTNHPDGTAHGGTAILIKETIEHYELLKYKEESIEVTSINVKRFPYEITITTIYCPSRHNLKRNSLRHSFKR